MSPLVPAVDPQRTALLVMDFQESVVAALPGPEADRLVCRVADAVDCVRGAGGHVGHVRVGFTPAERERIPPGNRMFAALAERGGLEADGPETRFVSRLVPWEGDIVVRKTRVGAFSTTDLDEQLRGRSVDSLVLAGVVTSGVVLSTLRDAADRDYRLLVLSDGCADSDQQTHEILMGRVFPRQADVLPAGGLPAVLGPQGD